MLNLVAILSVILFGIILLVGILVILGLISDMSSSRTIHRPDPPTRPPASRHPKPPNPQI